MKLVSICIPAYKPEHFRECVTSAISQTYKPCEIIVSDDCPGDDIRVICEDYRNHIKYVRNPQPGNNGRNNVKHLCRMAEGYYLKFLFDDDILSPFCVQYLVESLKSTSSEGTILAFSPRQVIDAKSRPCKRINLLSISEQKIIPGNALIEWMATHVANPIGEFTTVLFRKNDVVETSGNVCIGEVEGDPWRGLGDVATWIHLAQKGKIVAHPETLSFFRSHGSSNSNPQANSELIYAVTDWKKFIDWAQRRGVIEKHALAQSYYNLIRLFRHWFLLYPELIEEMQNISREINQLHVSFLDRLKLNIKVQRILNRSANRDTRYNVSGAPVAGCGRKPGA